MIFRDDGISGAVSRRPGLTRCLRKLEKGDTLVVWKLDRLGRSLRDLIIMLDDLKIRGIHFRSPENVLKLLGGQSVGCNRYLF